MSHMALFLMPTLGGVVLGVGSSLLFLCNGRICGISGIVSGLWGPDKGERSWRFAFIAGLLTGGFGLAFVRRDWVALASEQTMATAIVAGVLVGIGTRMSHGCTSGHGLCGIARLSPRSVVATLVFTAVGAATVFVMRHVLHGGAS